MVGKAPLEPVSTVGLVPWGSVLREVVLFRRRRLGRTARRLEHALTVRDLRAAARRTTPRAVFDYVDGAAPGAIVVRERPPYRSGTPDGCRC